MIDEANVKNYDETKLKNAFDTSKLVKNELDEIATLLENFSFNDSRLNEHYKSFFDAVTRGANDIHTVSDDVLNKSFIKWFDELLVKLADTIAKVNGIATETPNEPPSDSGVDTPSPSAEAPSEVTPESPSDGGVDTPTPTASAPVVVNPESPSTGIKDVGAEEQDSEKIDPKELDETFDAKKSEIQSTDPADKYYIDKDKWSKISTTLQSAVIAGLKKVGYEDEEVNDIVNGKVGIPKVVLGTIGKTLKNTLNKFSDLKAVLKDKYGFDIFTDSGKIIPVALSGILFMDLKDANDQYDIIKQLKDDYGVTLVNQNLLNTYKQQLEELYKKDPSIRELILKKYGIDVFNEDGTVNDSNLTWAKIMDDADKKDDYDLAKLIKESEDKEKKDGQEDGEDADKKKKEGEEEVVVPTPSAEPTEVPIPSDTEEPTEIEVPTSTEEPTEVDVPTSTEEPTEIESPTSTEEPTEVEVPTSTEESTPTSTPTLQEDEFIIVPAELDVETPSEEPIPPDSVAPQVASSPAYVESYSPQPETIELPTVEEVVPTDEEISIVEPTEEEIPTQLEDADDVINRLTPVRNQVATVKSEIPTPTKKKDNSGLATIAGLGAAIAAAGAGAWMMRNKENNSDNEDEDEEFDDEYEVDSFNEGDKPIDITPYSSQENLSTIGMDGASIASEDDDLISTGANKQDIPASKDFLNQLEVEDEEPEKPLDEFNYYTTRQSDLEGADSLEEI
ncbi:MAG: hypothetical protein IKE70_03950 [Bacilli bacterium]|nr:hypothetical protein [Bacilli bacterium]